MHLRGIMASWFMRGFPTSQLWGVWRNRKAVSEEARVVARESPTAFSWYNWLLWLAQFIPHVVETRTTYQKHLPSSPCESLKCLFLTRMLRRTKLILHGFSCQRPLVAPQWLQQQLSTAGKWRHWHMNSSEWEIHIDTAVILDGKSPATFPRNGLWENLQESPNNCWLK